MGTAEFGIPALEAISFNHQIVGVYSQPDKPTGRGLETRSTPVKNKALKLGLQVFQPEKLATSEEFEKLRKLSPDVIVVVAYGKVLRKNFLDLPRLGCVNIHSSLLPRWRGAAPIQWALLNGDSESGVTIMKMVEELDAGEIYMQAKTPISGEETAGTLHDRLSTLGRQLILPALDGLEKGSIKGIPQNSSDVTYAEKLEKSMEWLNSQEPAHILDRKVRALNPWPGTSVWVEDPKIGKLRLKIKRARPWRDIVGNQGQIFERAGMVLLGTSAGSLELLTIQWEGKKETDSAGFLNGLRGRAESLPLKTVANHETQSR